MRRKLLAIGAVIVLHVCVFTIVNAVNGVRPASDLVNLHTRLDDWVPYLGWTAAVYYASDLFIFGWGPFVLSRLDTSFGRAIRSYVGMILAAGIIQMLVPAEASWADPSIWFQQRAHGTVPPYACLPSMHVALAVLPACLAPFAFRNRLLVRASVAGAVLTAVSTITAKEHYVVDLVAGLVCGLMAYGYWRLGVTARAIDGAGSTGRLSGRRPREVADPC